MSHDKTMPRVDVYRAAAFGGCHEGVVQDVLGHLGLAKDVDGEGKEHRRMPVVELYESAFVSIGDAT